MPRYRVERTTCVYGGPDPESIRAAAEWRSAVPRHSRGWTWLSSTVVQAMIRFARPHSRDRLTGPAPRVTADQTTTAAGNPNSGSTGAVHFRPAGQFTMNYASLSAAQQIGCGTAWGMSTSVDLQECVPAATSPTSPIAPTWTSELHAAVAQALPTRGMCRVSCRRGLGAAGVNADRQYSHGRGGWRLGRNVRLLRGYAGAGDRCRRHSLGGGAQPRARVRRRRSTGQPPGPPRAHVCGRSADRRCVGGRLDWEGRLRCDLLRAHHRRVRAAPLSLSQANLLDHTLPTHWPLWDGLRSGSGTRCDDSAKRQRPYPHTLHARA
jgi:hypothetical protein